MFTLEFIAPYKKLIDVVKEAYDEYPHSDEINLVISCIGVQEIQHHKLVGDIIIGRGLTVDYLHRILFNRTVIEIPMTGYDVFKAIRQGEKNNPNAKKAAFIATASATYGIKQQLDFLIPVTTYEIDPDSDVDAILRKAVAAGANLVIGGDTVTTRANALGIPNARVETGKDSARLAIDEAWCLFQSNINERIRVQRLNAIIENVQEGIILLDKDEHVTTCNHYAMDLMGLDQLDASKPIGEIIPSLNQPDCRTLKEPINGELSMLNGTQVAVSRIPININGTFFAGVITLQRLSQLQSIEARIRAKIHHKGLIATYHFSMILGSSTQLQQTKALARSYATTKANILIIGETGTGKEMFAQSIHNASSRRDGPFVAVNCAALPESLLESELFGYVAGAFTGASKSGKMGLFELAHRGTIFLDEISEMSLHLQGRLLRVIEEREIMRLGDDAVIPVDIHIIAATNRNLEQLVEEKKFRQDLFYRLDVLRLEIPPLRQRLGDISILANHFLEHYDTRGKITHIFSKEATSYMERLPWKGNVRQLKNICERLSVVVQQPVIVRQDVQDCLGGLLIAPPLTTGMTRQEIEETLKKTQGNKMAAAALLHIDRSTLYRRMRAYGMR